MDGVAQFQRSGSNSEQDGLDNVANSSLGSLGSWVEVSEVGSRPAVRVHVGLFSGMPSESLLEGLQVLLPRDAPNNSSEVPLMSAFDDAIDSPGRQSGDSTTSFFNEESFLRIAEADLGW